MKKALLAFAISLPASAFAGAPNLDSAAYCQRTTATIGASTPGGTEHYAAACKRQEELALESLKKNWDAQPENAKAQCQQVTESASGGYTILNTCIEQRAAAARASK
ncbi:hypothetical protein FACS1894205_4620 [Alphaproteobacteria bacterium]|nr:hypothetical protein FACS1894205_4620 [Alphaproteobacteria bacterium]